MCRTPSGFSWALRKSWPLSNLYFKSYLLRSLLVFLAGIVMPFLNAVDNLVNLLISPIFLYIPIIGLLLPSVMNWALLMLMGCLLGNLICEKVFLQAQNNWAQYILLTVLYWSGILITCKWCFYLNLFDPNLYKFGDPEWGLFGIMFISSWVVPFIILWSGFSLSFFRKRFDIKQSC